MNFGNHGTYELPDLIINGDHNIVRGSRCIVHGNHNTIFGDDCKVQGNHNKIKGERCQVKGNWNKATASCHMSGKHNTRLDPTLHVADPDPVLMMNNGQPTWKHLDFSSVESSFGQGTILRGFQFGQGQVSNTIICDQIGSVFGDGTIINARNGPREQSIHIGDQTLLLRDLHVDQITQADGRCTFKIGSTTLVVRAGQLYCDEKVINLDRLFQGQKQITLDWAELKQRLPELTRILLQGQDQPTDDESKACVICLSNEKVCAAIPCGHVLFCIGCANQFNLDLGCPTCRGPISTVNRIFA